MDTQAPAAATAFTTDQLRATYPDGAHSHYWNIARNRILDGMLRRDRPSNDAILEIGCGRGQVVDFLRRRGHNCTGCDLAPGLPYTEEVTPHLTFETDALELPPNVRASVKTILLLDVIEHVPEPGPFMHGIADAFPAMGTADRLRPRTPGDLVQLRRVPGPRASVRPRHGRRSRRGCGVAVRANRVLLSRALSAGQDHAGGRHRSADRVEIAGRGDGPAAQGGWPCVSARAEAAARVAGRLVGLRRRPAALTTESVYSP